MKLLREANSFCREEGAAELCRAAPSALYQRAKKRVAVQRYTLVGTPVVPVETGTSVGAIPLQVDPNWPSSGRHAAGVPYEPVLMELLYEALDGDEVLYNVGARWGLFSLFARRCGVPAPDVHSFEADEENFERLEANLEPAMPRSLVRVGNADGGGTLRLDNYAEEHEMPTLLKVDVEGAEHDVILGMERVLSIAEPHLYVEVHPEKLVSMGTSQYALLSALEDHGYAMTVYTAHREDERSGRPVEEVDLPEGGDYLIEAVPPS